MTRSANFNMIIAYWFIGKEIVEEIQNGEERAAYEKQILKSLSEQLNSRY